MYKRTVISILVLYQANNMFTIHKFTPKLNLKGNRKPRPKWFTGELKKLTRLKNTLWYKLLSASVANKPAINAEYKSTCKSIKKLIKTTIHSFELDLAIKSKKNRKLL